MIDLYSIQQTHSMIGKLRYFFLSIDFEKNHTIWSASTAALEYFFYVYENKPSFIISSITLFKN